MARPYPSAEEVKAKRPNVEDYLGSESLEVFILESLSYLKRDLENRRGIEWAQVFTTTYLGTGRNESNLVHLMVLRTLALVFEAYSVKASDGQFWEIASAYRADYDSLLSECKLDVDVDGDGAIDASEAAATAQPFFSR